MKHLQKFEQFGGANTVTLYHLTDKPNFELIADFAPEDNAVSLHSREGMKGIYVTDSVSRWIHGHHYHRPFIVEFEVDAAVANNPDRKERWGGEIFIPNDEYDAMKIVRIIGTDALTREQYGAHGAFEGAARQEFDTGKPITLEEHWANPNPFKNYIAKDVRTMSADEISLLLQTFEAGDANWENRF